MMDAPCKTCPEKGCGAKHDTCEKYLEFTRSYKKTMKVRKEIGVLNYLARPPKWRNKTEYVPYERDR